MYYSTAGLAIGAINLTAGNYIRITFVGAGGPDGLGISALACFTASPSTAVWLFPNRSMVPLGSGYVAPNTILSIRQPTAVTLHRGDGFISQGGLYCCGSPTNENERLCIAISKSRLWIIEIIS